MDEWITQALEEIELFCDKGELGEIKKRVNHPCDKTFSQGISELVVSKYFAERFQSGLLLPRSRTNKSKDIDVSILLEDQRINIEVKAPDLSFENEKEFTVKAPYKFINVEELGKVKNTVSRYMNGNVMMVPNKIRNAENFLDGCCQKFTASADDGDINIVLFSMLQPSGMDDYRIKLEDEALLSKYSSIHAVVLSDAAMRHQRHQPNTQLGLENSFNYVIRNICPRSSVTEQQLSSAISCIHHSTDEARTWFQDNLQQLDNLGKLAFRLRWLELFNSTEKN